MVSLDPPGRLQRPAPNETGDDVVLNCPAHLPAALGAPSPTGLGHGVEGLLIAAAPEFLGALAAALVIAAATAARRYLHRRRSTTHETDSAGAGRGDDGAGR